MTIEMEPRNQGAGGRLHPLSTAHPTKTEADFLLTADVRLFARYIDCQDMAHWTTPQWHEAVTQAARAWDAEGRPSEGGPPRSLVNRCACGKHISENKVSCYKHRETN